MTVPKGYKLVRVTDPSGMMLRGYGSREFGESFTVPTALAKDLLKTYPSRLEEVEIVLEMEVAAPEEAPPASGKKRGE